MIAHLISGPIIKGELPAYPGLAPEEIAEEGPLSSML